MSDAYDFRPGGSLKLKGGGEKKKKHKSSSQTSSKKTIIGEELVAKAKPTETHAKDDSPVPSGSRHESPAGTSSANASGSKKTAAEIRFEESQRKRRLERVSKLAAQTHKDRVHEFNAKLEALSEHHDIPKVGPG